jgi:hypothetical protein
LDPCVQVLDALIEALFVGLPRHAVDAGSRVTSLSTSPRRP